MRSLFLLILLLAAQPAFAHSKPTIIASDGGWYFEYKKPKMKIFIPKEKDDGSFLTEDQAEKIADKKIKDYEENK